MDRIDTHAEIGCVGEIETMRDRYEEKELQIETKRDREGEDERKRCSDRQRDKDVDKNRHYQKLNIKERSKLFNKT